MLQKLQSIDRRIVYLVFFFATAIPFVRPVALPMSIAPFTQSAYNAIEALKPGDVVLIDVRFGPSTVGELYPPYEAALTHMLKKQGLRILWFCEDPTGPVYAENGVKMAQAAGYTYGKDIAYLGYLAGEETAMAAIAQDITKAFPNDSRNNKTADMEVLKNVKTAKDFSLILNISSGGVGPLGWIRQATTPFGTKQVSILSQVMVPSAIPYFQSNQLLGIMSGLQGAAEYEQLLGKPGRGLASMGAQTFGHLWLITLVVAANAAYLVGKGQEGRGKAE